jgi:hypothetical protein
VETDSPKKEKFNFGRWFRKWDVEAWTGSIWFRRGTGGGNL